MSEFNKGLIYTNSNCIGCNRCISGCPITGANVAVITENGMHIQVDSDKCIHCGHCLSVCKHNAREYRDDVDIFFSNLTNKKNISLAVAPSFYLFYEKKAYQILGYLKSIGVNKIYNVSFGADISTWATLKYFDSTNDYSGISQSCSAIVNFLEQESPNYLSKLIPVHSPLMCLATYVREEFNDTNEIAFLGPCIAKTDEIKSKDTLNLVQYNITFKHLMEKLKDVNLSGYSCTPDINDFGLGVLYPLSGGMKENFGALLNNKVSFIPLDNLSERFTLSRIQRTLKGMTKVSILEPLNCEFGCLTGPGVEKDDNSLAKNFKYADNLRKQILSDSKNPFYMSKDGIKSKEKLYKYFENLNWKRYCRKYSSRLIKTTEVSEDELDKIFNDMYKKTEKERNIDCQYCGYETCKEMAIAIAHGYNIKSNCIQYEKLENARLFTTDSLTGLPNKFMFIHFCNRLISKHLQNDYTIAQVNVTKFMLINNQYGYETGNEAIKQIAIQIQSCIVDDEFLATSGGNDFFIAVKNERINSVLFNINHISINICTDFDKRSFEHYSISIHAGVYKLSNSDDTAEKAIEKTLTAFLVSKENNDIVSYKDTMSVEVLRNVKIGKLIPQALTDNELCVYYQPKVDISSLKLSGAEALIRWNHDGKIVSPADFVPICEKNGFIKRIDFFVLNTVCKNIRSWLDANLQPVKVSINFSKLHFLQSDIAERIRNIVDQWEIPHSLIEIEVTETAYLNSQSLLEDTMKQLAVFGFSTAMDDFGTGYSSLSLLQNLPFDVLKLDKSLADKIQNNERSHKVVTNIIHMAKELDMNVVVEGVESANSIPLFKELNCDSIQGFIFDKPLTEKDFRKRLIQPAYQKNE